MYLNLGMLCRNKMKADILSPSHTWFDPIRNIFDSNKYIIQSLYIGLMIQRDWYVVNGNYKYKELYLKKIMYIVRNIHERIEQYLSSMWVKEVELRRD